MMDNDEAYTKAELLFALHQRDRPTVVFIECNSYSRREEIAVFLRAELTEYQFHTIDLTPFPVVSLLRILTEKLPESIVQSQPVHYVVNVYGLENSLVVSEDGRIRHSDLTAQLNLERELLFRNVPYIIILWADYSFFHTLQREAPDLWSWVTYKFRFEGDDPVFPENAAPIPAERLPQRGNVEERQSRIRDLLDAYHHLNLDSRDKARLLKDKINILKLLAEEYAEAYEWTKSEDAYYQAISLAERLQENDFLRGSLYFGLGQIYLYQRRFQEALDTYQKCFTYFTDWNQGALYHQIGMVYEEQRQWELALQNYQKAIEWYTKTGNKFALGGSYHQIGRVYEEQGQFNIALEWYEKALQSLIQFNHPDLGIAQASVNCVKEKLESQPNA
ncbi:tetratricopeptide repeat protein [Larkinella sp. VNQ87]|uniref:tetratricopeptide repeat protein n=1 Tax=Larkinella sp. VNQ87 TaxID=3400921 RepID=UPI003BFF19D5